MTAFASKWRFNLRRRLMRTARRMSAASRAGSAAVEFAFVAPVFFILLLGTMEVGIMYFSQFVLQNALDDAARLVRTGQVTGSLPGQTLTQAQLNAGQTAGQPMTQAQFRAYVCNEITPLLACDGNLQIDVETFTSFSNASFPNALQANNTLNPNLNNYQTGVPCNVELVRAFYTWNVVTPLLTPFMTNMANNQHLLSATAAFRNEPYTTGIAGC